MTSPLKIFVNFPVQNKYQTAEMFMIEYYIQKAKPNAIINDVLDSTAYYPVYFAQFDGPLGYINMTTDPVNVVKFIAYAGWFATTVYQIVNSDLVFTEGNDVVMYPGVVTVQSIATALGIPTTMWRNDARVLWNTTMDPIMALAVAPNYSDALIPNITVQNVTGKTNNIKILIDRSNANKKPKNILPLQGNKLKLAHNLGSDLMTYDKDFAKNLKNSKISNLSRAQYSYGVIRGFIVANPTRYLAQSDIIFLTFTMVETMLNRIIFEKKLTLTAEQKYKIIECGTSTSSLKQAMAMGADFRKLVEQCIKTYPS